jgi:hypothetical protein
VSGIALHRSQILVGTNGSEMVQWFAEFYQKPWSSRFYIIIDYSRENRKIKINRIEGRLARSGAEFGLKNKFLIHFAGLLFWGSLYMTAFSNKSGLAD